MARPERKNVDYFPHYMSHGAKMKYLENKYGNDGYAVWYKIIERLAHSENHYVDLNDDIQVTFLSDFCKVEEEVLLEIIEFLVKAKWLHKGLWEKRVLFSSEFLGSIQDAYERRKNDCIKQEAIELMYHINTQESDISEPVKPQSKGEYSKPNETKEEKERVYFQNEKLNDAFTKWLKMCKEVGKDYPESAIEAMQMKLNTSNQALAIVKQSLEKGWKTLHPIENKQKGSNEIVFASPII